MKINRLLFLISLVVAIVLFTYVKMEDEKPAKESFYHQGIMETIFLTISALMIIMVLVGMITDKGK